MRSHNKGSRDSEGEVKKEPRNEVRLNQPDCFAG